MSPAAASGMVQTLEQAGFAVEVSRDGGTVKISAYLNEDDTSLQAPDIPCERELVIVVAENRVLDGTENTHAFLLCDVYLTNRARLGSFRRSAKENLVWAHEEVFECSTSCFRL